MKLSVIIPNYNGESLLRKNLPKVIDAISSHNAEIIIVDDFSTDASIQVIEEFVKTHKQIKLETNKRNQGFSYTVNKGVRMSSGELLILLNTDVAPHKDFLGPLLKHFQDEKVFAVGCLDQSIEAGHAVPRGRGVGKWTRGFMIHSAGTIDKKNTLWVSGGSGAFRKNVWDKLQGLDEIYSPFYWEDIDLSYRARKAGYITLFEKGSIVVHEHSKGAIKSKYSPSKIKRISYRNQFIFVWKNVTSVRLFLSHIGWLPYHFFKALLRLDFSFFSGFFQALLKIPSVIGSRRKAVKQFVLSDNAVFQNLDD